MGEERRRGAMSSAPSTMTAGRTRRMTRRQPRTRSLEAVHSQAPAPRLNVTQMRYSVVTREGMMMAQTSMLHVRVDDKLKAEAAEKLANFGLTVSDAVRVLLT